MKSGQFKDMSRSERLLEAAEMVAEVVAVHGVPRVADDHLTALAVRETPVDDVLAQRTTCGLHVPMTRAIRRERPSVEDDPSVPPWLPYHRTRPFYPRFSREFMDGHP